MDGLADWQSRPLDAVYAVIFIDAINVKIREGKVANRPIYLALGVTVDGERDVLGLWAGEHGDGEGAKYWLRVLLRDQEPRRPGTCCMLVCDGLQGSADAVSAVWEKTIVQTCIVHLLRNSFKYASKRDWAQIAKDLKPVYTAASESEALDRFAEFSGKWEKRYPAIIRLWENAWAEFVPFLRFDREIRTVICTTNAIESINARLRRAVNARGHFPTEQAALKCLYLAIMSLDPTGKGRQAVDQPVEGRPERLRHHLRRPPQRGTQVTTEKEVTSLKRPLQQRQDWCGTLCLPKISSAQVGVAIRFRRGPDELVALLRSARCGMMIGCAAPTGLPGCDECSRHCACFRRATGTRTSRSWCCVTRSRSWNGS